jgi:5-methylcytosine-specific restriction protein A
MPTIRFKKKKRDNTVNKFQYQSIYNTPRWKKLRAAKVAENPLCEVCLRVGRVVPTDEVHHIRPLDFSMTRGELEELAYDWDNLLSVCVPCHKNEHIKISR